MDSDLDSGHEALVPAKRKRGRPFGSRSDSRTITSAPPSPLVDDGGRGIRAGGEREGRLGPKRIWTKAILKAVLRVVRDGDNVYRQLDRLAASLVAAGLAGEIAALREIGDRLEGKPSLILESEDGDQMRIVINVNRGGGGGGNENEAEIESRQAERGGGHEHLDLPDSSDDRESPGPAEASAEAQGVVVVR